MQLENERLQQRVEELEQTLRAIREGAVDGLVVYRGEHPQAYVLEGAEKPYRVFLEAMKEGAVTASTDGTIVYCNRQFARMVRRPLERVVGQPLLSFVAPESVEKLQKLLDASSAESSQEEIILGIDAKPPLPTQFSVTTMLVDDMRSSCIVVTDLTQQKKVEQVLRESGESLELRVRQRTAELHEANLKLEEEIATRVATENELRLSEQNLNDFFENAAVGLHWVGPDGVILRANRAELDLLGYEESEYVGHHISEFHADSHRIEDILRRLTLGETIHNYEARLRCRDGSTRDVVITSNVLWQDGRFVHTRCFTRDITERKIVEKALKERSEELETLLDTLPIGVLIAYDVDCLRVTGNKIATDLMRLPSGANLSRVPHPASQSSFRVFRHSVELERGQLPLQRAARGEQVRGDEIELAFDDGTALTTFISASPLRDAQGQLRGAVGVMVDITAYKRLESELRRRADELAVADRRKDEFLATLAHELRSPLAPIASALQAMRQAKWHQTVVESAYETIERQLQHIVRLLSDLMDISRIATGRIHLQKEPVELAGALKTALESSKPLIEAGGHRLHVTSSDTPIYLDADPTRVTQILSNLLNNAAKYTPPGGEIILTATSDGKEVCISVKDSGVGISAEMLPRVFNMFTQASRPQVSGADGLGIGLALVRNLVELHGGSIQARSGGLNQGSEFFVRLPVATQLTAPRPVETAKTAPRALPRWRRVLVVDDHRDAADNLSLLLELMGHEAKAAYDGATALQTSEIYLPEVIFLDITLPDLSGYEVAKAIRERSWGENVSLIALTGRAHPEDKERSIQAGFNHHMLKPIDFGALQALLDS